MARAIGDDRSVRLWTTADGKLALDWGLSGVPETYLVDGAGIVRLHYHAPLSERDLATILPLLAPSLVIAT